MKNKTPITRRKILFTLSTLGISSAVLAKILKENPEARTALLRKSKDALSWLREQGRAIADEGAITDPEKTRKPTREEIAAYTAFLETIPLRYIKPYEIIRAHHRNRNGVYNQLPDEKLWEKIIPSLHVADELRHKLGVPLKSITSAYRSPAYNAQCPGAVSNSYHTRNMALDLIYDADSKTVTEAAKELRDQGFFRGGIGTYPNFVHIDTRGRNATWSS